MATWSETQGPVPDWDPDTRARTALGRRTRTETILLALAGGVVAAGLLVALLSIQARLGILELLAQFPGLVVGGILVAIGLLTGAFLVARLLRRV